MRKSEDDIKFETLRHCCIHTAATAIKASHLCPKLLGEEEEHTGFESMAWRTRGFAKGLQDTARGQEEDTGFARAARMGFASVAKGQ